MALTWNMRDVVKSETTEDSATHYVMCMMTIHTGMREITEDNADEFFRRVEILEADDAIGPCRGNDKGMIRLTRDDVRAFIGLKTNATPYTPRQFAAHVKRIRAN